MAAPTANVTEPKPQDLLARAPDEADLVRRSAMIIERRARIIGRRIEDLMDVSAAQRGNLRLRPARIAVTELVRQSLETISKMIEAHGGSIVAASAGPGLGSTFTIRIPAATPGKATPAIDPIPSSPRHSTHRKALRDAGDRAP